MPLSPSSDRLQEAMDPALLDDIIRRLLEVRASRPGKQVQLSETEIRQLCLVASDIFLHQPNLLELEAPIKICGLIPCFVLLAGLFFIPESPRWLAKVGREKQFLLALQTLRGTNADITQEAADIQECIEELQLLPKTRFQDLFQSRNVRPITIGVGLMVFQQFGGVNGVGFYASEVFVSAGFVSGNIGTILLGCTQISVTALGAILIDISGRRPLLMIE